LKPSAAGRSQRASRLVFRLFMRFGSPAWFRR
jgi:hypothetical protein